MQIFINGINFSSSHSHNNLDQKIHYYACFLLGTGWHKGEKAAPPFLPLCPDGWGTLLCSCHRLGCARYHPHRCPGKLQWGSSSHEPGAVWRCHAAYVNGAGFHINIMVIFKLCRTGKIMTMTINKWCILRGVTMRLCYYQLSHQSYLGNPKRSWLTRRGRGQREAEPDSSGCLHVLCGSLPNHSE